ncbi:hypothetical protein BT96DRAFT_1004844 [Gymnopus androsaceus JB14]|uniref:Uncharacterized protein n=1 Tax=Gymnopus androsaceus JB14 TaxID=1447944 RepID=A0A6A4GRA7_9AGAR|nr:hypothetical protein BT96DRAFT_1004844 [Gymnopus androsaceus JB14]
MSNAEPSNTPPPAGVPRVIKLQRIKQAISMRWVPLKPGLAENTMDDGTGVVPSRKRGQPRKNDVDAGGTEDANVKQQPKKKRT